MYAVGAMSQGNLNTDIEDNVISLLGIDSVN